LRRSNGLGGIAAIISAGAAIVAAAAAYRTIRLMDRANVLAVAIDVFREFRSDELHDHLRYVRRELPKSGIPYETGYMNLPESARAHVVPVSHYFDNLGILLANRVIDEELILSFMGESIEETWEVLRPYIRQEEKLRGGQEYQRFFEHAAALAQKRPAADIRRKLNLQKALLR
jgi:hypothetical protein